MRRFIVMLIAFLGLAVLPSAGAEAAGTGSEAGVSTRDKIEIGVTFTDKWAKISNTTGTRFAMPGGAVDVFFSLGNKVKHLGIAAEVQGETATTDVWLGAGLSQITFVAGPRYYLWEERQKEGSRRRSAKVYCEALVGGMHAFNSLFTSGGKTTSSANSFALQAGGGMDLPLPFVNTHKVGFRLVEADFILTKLPNTHNDTQGDFRASTGLTFHF
ncbi:MAG: hypothetical protein ABSD88_03185 [Candidatus Korobacteraceae bacterium]